MTNLNSNKEIQVLNEFEKANEFIIIYYYLLFSHLADAFIQSDLQMRTTEAINCSIKTNKNRSKTKS